MSSDLPDRNLPAFLTPDEPLTDELLRIALIDGPADLDETRAAEAVTAFEVIDDALAEWCLRKLAAYRDRAAEVKRHADEWRAQVDAWEDQELGRITPSVEFFTGHLERYALAQRGPDPENPVRASVTLPSGKIATTHTKARVVVDDDEALALWLADRGPTPEDLVKWTPKVYVGPLRKLLEIQDLFDDYRLESMSPTPVLAVDPATGERLDVTPVVPGVAVEPARTTAKVSVR